MIKINDFFDKVYVINLKSRPERLKLCKQELNKNGIEHEVFEAVIGNPGVEVHSKYLRNRPGAVGCLLSHIGVIKNAKKLGLNKILVIEDDVEFCKNFIQVFDKMVKDLPEDWDMFYLGGSGHVNPNNNVLTEITKNISKTTGTMTTSSYGISGNIFDVVIENASKMIEPIDSVYKYRIQCNYNCYVTRPNIAWQKPGYSDIANGNRDYTSFMKNK